MNFKFFNEQNLLKLTIFWMKNSRKFFDLVSYKNELICVYRFVKNYEYSICLILVIYSLKFRKIIIK